MKNLVELNETVETVCKVVNHNAKIVNELVEKHNSLSDFLDGQTKHVSDALGKIAEIKKTLDELVEKHNSLSKFVDGQTKTVSNALNKVTEIKEAFNGNVRELDEYHTKLNGRLNDLEYSLNVAIKNSTEAFSEIDQDMNGLYDDINEINTKMFGDEGGEYLRSTKAKHNECDECLDCCSEGPVLRFSFLNGEPITSLGGGAEWSVSWLDSKMF